MDIVAHQSPDMCCVSLTFETALTYSSHNVTSRKHTAATATSLWTFLFYGANM